MTRAIVEPTVLRWARESRGLSVEVAAKRIGVKPERLNAWEESSSDLRPTVRQLRTAASVYQRPLGLFFLPDPPTEDETVRDFRRLSEPPFSEEHSPALRLELRLARERRLDAVELAEQLGFQPPRLSIRANLRTDPDRLAARIRSKLGVTASVQRSWGDTRVAFNSWRDRIEANGILVFQTGGSKTHAVDPKEARGFSIAEHPLPAIVANGSDAYSARCFTLLHELTHVLLREGGLCDLHEANSARQGNRTEVFCNRVAGAVLVPEEDLIALTPRSGGNERWDDGQLEALAKAFSVSPEVILRRLLILGQTSDSFYEGWRQRRQRDVERAKKQGRKRPGFLTPANRAIKRNGKLFTRLVFQALDARHVTLSSTTNLLQTGSTHLEKVRNSSLGGAS